MPITINILGSCVSRDVFGLFPNDGGFDIKQYVANSSFISICSPPIADEKIAEFEDFPKSPHFQQRCAVLDINKNVFDYLMEYDSDYLVLDLGTIHKKIFKVKRLNPDENSNYTFITESRAIHQNPSFLENNDKIQIVKSFLFNDGNKDGYMSYLRKFANLLKSLYPQKKLIIIEVRFAERYFDENGKIQDMSKGDMHKKNMLLDDLQTEMRRLLPDAHYIRFPGTEVLGNKIHRWGLHELHLVCEYYQYVMDAIKVITANLEDEKLFLDILYGKYTDILREKYITNKYSLKNNSFPDKTEITLGKSVKFSLCSQGGSAISYYGVFYKFTDEKNWSVLTKDNYIDKEILWTPEKAGEYDVCLKVKDSNNFIKRNYFKISVKG